MTKKEEKRALRATLRRIAEELPESYRQKADAAIAAHLLAMPAYQEAETVFCFVGTGWEIDTRPILTRALSDGKRLCVPLCTGPGIMELRQITALDQLAPGAYHLPEPPADAPLVAVDQVDLAVLPCMGCNHLGHRLGRGGGFYDRFLAAYRAAAVLVCRERLIREEIPLEPHDLPIPWVLTERGLYEDGTPARLG